MSRGNALDIETFFGHTRDGMASFITSLWTQWSSASNQNTRRWEEILRYLTATSTKDTTNESAADWSNTTHRPKIANIWDTLTINYDAALFPNDDWLVWEGGDVDSASLQKRRIVESYMKTKHKIPASRFRPTMRKLEEDWVAFGNCFAQVDFVRESVEDTETGTFHTSYIGPRVSRIDPRDIQFNPLATSFEESPKIIRTLFTVGELSRLAQERPDQPYWQEILDIAKQTRGHIRQYDQGDIQKDLLLEFDGFGNAFEYFNSGLVEVLEFYGDIYEELTDTYRKNHVITIVDRYDVVRDEPLNTWSGRPHIFHAGWRGRSGNLWAQGPLDNLIGLQFRIDHLENARADAFDQMIDPDIVFAGDVEEIMQVGGAKHYFIAENGNVQHLRPDTTVLNADLQIQELLDFMEVMALAPREALGIRSPGEKTAFEVAELTTAAGRAFQHKANIFNEFIEHVVNAELEVAAKNIDATDVIEVVDDELGTVEFRTITAADLKANGRLIPVGARHFARNAQLIQNINQLQLGPLQDPEIMQHFSALGMADLYQELLDLSGNKKTIVQPYVRIQERLESQRRMQVAQQLAQEEAATPSGDETMQQVEGDISAGRGQTLNFAGFGTR